MTATIALVALAAGQWVWLVTWWVCRRSDVRHRRSLDAILFERHEWEKAARALRGQP